MDSHCKSSSSSKEPVASFASHVQRCPVSRYRPLATHAAKFIDNPGLGRLNSAPSVEHPHGSVEYSKKFEHLTVLQQHVSFWDRDGDGIITMLDTYRGFRDLGFNVLISAMSILININFSYATKSAHHWLPDPFFRIYIDSIHKSQVWRKSFLFAGFTDIA